MRAAIYARYSSDNQRDASIEDQVRQCRARIDLEGWRPGDVYSDRAISGATILRPGYQKMLEDAREGRFDVLVAEALDRLSRDQENIAGLFKLLSFAGVKLVTLSEGEINEMHVGLKGTMNALFLKDLAQKTRRGLEGRVRQGMSGGGNSYGYDVVHKTQKPMEIERGHRRINSAEAELVLRIFKEYAAGKSPRRIAFDLNADGIPGPSGKDWGPSTINGNRARGTGILNNELYIGRLVWNRQRYVKNPDTGKRISRPNSPEEWIIHQVPELRIINDELWDQVKTRQDTVKRGTRPDCTSPKPFWQQTRPKYLFSGLMKCGACGGSYTKISANLFGCATARNKGTCDNRLTIRRDAIEETVLDALKYNLMDPDLFKEFADEFYREVNRLRLKESAWLDQVRSDLDTVDRKLRKIVDAIAEGVSARTLKDELLTLEARKEELKLTLASAKDPEPLIHPNLAEVYRQKVADLFDAFHQETDKSEAFDMLRSLVDEITFSPDKGELRIDLRGELASILSLCSDNQKPASNARDGLEQIKMVAGVGFEPTTFRL